MGRWPEGGLRMRKEPVGVMSSQGHIAICDDEQAIADLVSQLLETQGFDTTVFYNGADLVSACDHVSFDLVVLDIMMPGIDGIECCRRIRRKSRVPIIFLTAKDSEADKVVGFELGADDYVVKSFKPRELVARIRARMRTDETSDEVRGESLERGGLVLREREHVALLFDEELSLTPKEFGILSVLLRNAGSPVSSQAIFEDVWSEPADESSNNTVMVHIRHLRKKLADIDSSQAFIETVWGVGYRIP